MRSIKYFVGEHVYIFSVFIILIAVGATYLLGGYIVPERVLPTNCATDYKFINPEPDCETFESKLEQMLQLQSKLETQIQKAKDAGQADEVGVFARDLLTRRFVGVNENKIFDMASLLKVPLAVAYFKYAEVIPEVLANQILYQGKPDLYLLQGVQPSQKLKIGGSYSVEELLRRALVYSDNTAAEILAEQLPPDFLNEILMALSIRFDNEGAKEDLVTPKTYANVFRILYNSSYLTREYSDKLLSLLTETDYKNGASVGLPADTKIVHKFGERSLYVQKTNELVYRQLHDCGIVYLNQNKNIYTFCIMTQGKNFDDLQKVIQDLSLTIYEGMK